MRLRGSRPERVRHYRGRDGSLDLVVAPRQRVRSKHEPACARARRAGPADYLQGWLHDGSAGLVPHALPQPDIDDPTARPASTCRRRSTTISAISGGRRRCTSPPAGRWQRQRVDGRAGPTARPVRRPGASRRHGGGGRAALAQRDAPSAGGDGPRRQRCRRHAGSVAAHLDGRRHGAVLLRGRLRELDILRAPSSAGRPAATSSYAASDGCCCRRSVPSHSGWEST
jgi:hypothetical protein